MRSQPTTASASPSSSRSRPISRQLPPGLSAGLVPIRLPAATRQNGGLRRTMKA
ncbi:hypothetical protein [Halovulum marinum]|uniref:hypothetical protein n=1 Tax=Halovulum marinum TaxID=2662447 RepID=UPI0012B3C98C|nr:hypothetical protein [Halovulum marinum]